MRYFPVTDGPFEAQQFNACFFLFSVIGKKKKFVAAAAMREPVTELF